ncbi:hypothetical protein DID88_005451 [Monilinia fructigena]|uniref:Uncharacterized protein n=1 Tax=Monilinia fructigena TaxID=38457 RepID=A0A395J0M8_9HELO|nr:hypothetical protein DID88_005451 [Monilinia fructigena]
MTISSVNKYLRRSSKSAINYRYSTRSTSSRKARISILTSTILSIRSSISNTNLVTNKRKQFFGLQRTAPMGYHYEPSDLNGSPRPGTPSTAYGGSPRPLPPAPLFAAPGGHQYYGDDATIHIPRT